MLASFKKLVRWCPVKSADNKNIQTSFLLSSFIGLLEDILFWENVWLSLSFIFFVNILFFVFINEQVNILQFVCAFCITLTSIDALEAWLKYKHRTSFLKRIASYEPVRLYAAATKLKYWLKRRSVEFVYLRETNHTKAFLLTNILLGIIFITGKYMNGYALAYLICMLICTYKKVATPILKFARSIQTNAESDTELDNLIPEVTEADIQLLSLEPEKQVIDGKESLDYWKPNDLPVEEFSDDSSDNSSSIITNMSKEKLLHSLDKDVETSDSSEDEYIPVIGGAANALGQMKRLLPSLQLNRPGRIRSLVGFELDKPKEQLQSTLEVVSDGTWGSSAYNAFFSLTGAMANVMSAQPSYEQPKRKATSPDSSDSFEIIDKSELL